MLTSLMFSAIRPSKLTLNKGVKVRYTKEALDHWLADRAKKLNGAARRSGSAMKCTVPGARLLVVDNAKRSAGART